MKGKEVGQRKELGMGEAGWVILSRSADLTRPKNNVNEAGVSTFPLAGTSINFTETGGLR